ncbi:MAG: 4Fe-4S dicluster-binding protein [Armatimonadota bacterium]|nr:4Fe-4S dicluster-binding protein [Armatimonadota bacterium]MDR5703682.1 4Fe-4S dicluster-binding protein [Armatimonadota bacterium]MDR7435311.1 4Fe-4S dicluster-binding protein [Armatimonadota bacterium]
MERSYAVEIVYRGIFQKNLAKNIARGIVLAARREGKVGIAFGRYGDSPERNGIPAKQFAIVAPNEEILQESMAQYEPKEVDVTIVLDDTLCKGVESWAWYGLQPINKLLKPGGTLIVTSLLEPDELIKFIHRKPYEYNLAIVKGAASFSGLWVYKDDHTDVRVLGAVARVAPEMVSLGSIQQMILREWKNELKATSAEKSYSRITMRKVLPHEGNPEEPYSFVLPRWYEMREGIAIPAIPVGGKYNEEGGFAATPNPYFKKFSTRTMRPVVDFDKCVKCTLCWLQCPDTCYNVTPDGYYDVNLDTCCGCGVCEAVCPVDGCITMIHETNFTDHKSQWKMWKQDKQAYAKWVDELRRSRPPRSHGFQYRGQYEKELASIAEER